MTHADPADDRELPPPAEPEDIRAGAERLLRHDFEGERRQFEQAERRLVSLADRLASSQAEITVWAGTSVAGRCSVLGRDFCLVVPRNAPELVTCVPLHAIGDVTGLSHQVTHTAARRVDMPMVSWLQEWVGLQVRATLVGDSRINGVLHSLYQDHLAIQERVEHAIPYSRLATISLG
ncbi:MAG: hypothetical protein EB027_01105 [Actinobacteria bacterium]|nr:hypothetical protein [Actinomycetota bacterium]